MTDKEIIKISYILLSHYRTVSRISSEQFKEFFEYIFRVCPAVYAAFVNKSKFTEEDAKNIVSDYISLIKRTVKKMENATFNKNINFPNDDQYKDLCQSYKIICMLYINKKPVSKNEICKRLSLSIPNFNYHHRKALLIFSKYMKPIAEKMGYSFYVNEQMLKTISSAKKINKCS